MVTLLTSELVTNAVLHANSDIELMVCASNGVVRVEVSDTSPQVPTLPRLNPAAQTGRGLTLVEKGSSTWGVSKQAVGKTVWFEVAR